MWFAEHFGGDEIKEGQMLVLKVSEGTKLGRPKAGPVFDDSRLKRSCCLVLTGAWIDFRRTASLPSPSAVSKQDGQCVRGRCSCLAIVGRK
jgi:hypothetical protein